MPSEATRKEPVTGSSTQPTHAAAKLPTTEGPPLGQVVFHDPLCLAPYDATTLATQALGGTEATVVRIAEALGARVVQHNRSEAQGRYLPLATRPEVQNVVLLRDSQKLELMPLLYPNARVHLWLHDRCFPGSKRGRRLHAAGALLHRLGVQIVCVSNWLRNGVDGVLKQLGRPAGVRSLTLYNPIDDQLAPRPGPVDRDALVFFSSPNKGLAYTLDAFRALRRVMPSLRLQVANPGYRVRPSTPIDGVDWLGPLPHSRVIEEVRRALCVFYPNFVLHETFGLVFAESSAVGTPVLTHDCGSAAEVLADPSQLLSVMKRQYAYERIRRLTPAALRPRLSRAGARLGVFEPYLERIDAWRNGARPQPVPDARFRLPTIVAQWRQLLAASH